MFASADAIRHRRRCLQLVERLPAGRAHDELELDVLQALSVPFNALHGYSSAELQSTLERSAALAEQLGNTDTVVRNLVGLFAVRFVQGHNSLSHEIAARALALAEPGSDLSGQAHFAFAGSALSLGMLDTAATHFELALGLSPAAVTLLFGTLTAVHCRAWAAHAHWLLGDEAGAVTRCEEAVEGTRAVEHPFSLAVALSYTAITRQLQGDIEALSETVAELGELCQRYEFSYYGEWARVLGGWAVGGERGASEIGRGIERLRALGANARMPYWLSLLGETLAASGRHDDAAAVLDAALAAGSQRDDRWWLAEVLRLRAGLAPPSRAAGLLERAAELAAGQSSRTLSRGRDRRSPPSSVRTAFAARARRRETPGERGLLKHQTGWRLRPTAHRPRRLKWKRRAHPPTQSWPSRWRARSSGRVIPPTTNARRLQRDDRPAPGGDRPLRRGPRRRQLRRVRPPPRRPAGGTRRRPQRRRPRRRRRRPRHRPSPGCAQFKVDPAAHTVRGRGRVHLERRRRGDRRARDGRRPRAFSPRPASAG